LSGPEQGGGILDGCLGRGGGPVFGGDGLEDLPAMDLDASGGLDAQPHAMTSTSPPMTMDCSGLRVITSIQEG
jgi:hypothetical protein